MSVLIVNCILWCFSVLWISIFTVVGTRKTLSHDKPVLGPPYGPVGGTALERIDPHGEMGQSITWGPLPSLSATLESMPNRLGDNDLFRRLDVWRQNQFGEFPASPPGAGENEIREAEAALGVHLPHDLRTAFALHNPLIDRIRAASRTVTEHGATSRIDQFLRTSAAVLTSARDSVDRREVTSGIAL